MSKRTALYLALGGLLGAASAPSAFAQAATAADSFVSDASYQQTDSTLPQIQQVGLFDGPARGHGCAEFVDPACGCEIAHCGGQCIGGCGGGVGCGNGCCGDADCGCGDSCGPLLDCNLGDPFSLFGTVGNFSIGGWASLGYHNNALPIFNNRPDEYQLHQAWVYAEKAIDTSCGFDIGGRIDYIYGTDGPNTQAFGIANDHWDNDFDNGPDDSGYGHAIPQLYVEAGYGDLSVKAGHFYTIIGYEVVAAPDNFFYSHAYTFNYSEPFTHTGALATYGLSDDLEVYGGYVFGWDSGFEDNGDAFLGGASLTLNDDVSITYATVAGRFGDGNTNRILDDGPPVVRGLGENGYMHSIVTQVALTEKLQYIGQSDLLTTENRTGAKARETYGLNQYLIHTINDCVALGARFEWYDAQTGIFANDNVDMYALTLGVNYKPHANVLIRPEIRSDWVDGNPAEILENDDDDQITFGIDTIFLF